MKKNTWRAKPTFGPAIEHFPDGSSRALCTWCVFRIGASCTYAKPSRTIPNPENTPEWCEMRDDMMKEAEAAHRSAETLKGEA